MAKYRTYKKELDYSYTLGIFLTIELLENKPKCVLAVIISSTSLDSQGVSKITELCKKHNISMEVNDKLITVLSPKENCYAIGIFNKYSERLSDKSNHLVLVNPSDSGNLGTIMRTSVGFDVLDIAIIKPAVDIFDPKAIRSSMGSMFHLRFQYFSSFGEYETNYPRHYYPFMLKAKKSIHEIRNVPTPYSLIFGNEAKGLDDSYLDIGTSIVIPHSDMIDSLNLSIATGIALYQFNKK